MVITKRVNTSMLDTKKENSGAATPEFFIWASCRDYDDLTTCTDSDQLPVPQSPLKELIRIPYCSPPSCCQNGDDNAFIINHSDVCRNISDWLNNLCKKLEVSTIIR